MRLAFLLHLALWGSLVLALPALLFVLFRALARGSGLEGPSCSACSYPVSQLPSHICPECGADLRQPGAVTYVHRRRTWAVAGQLVAMSVFMFACWVILMNIANNVLPQRMRTTSYAVLAGTEDMTFAALIAGESVEWEAPDTSIGDAPPPLPERIVVSYHAPISMAAAKQLGPRSFDVSTVPHVTIAGAAGYFHAEGPNGVVSTARAFTESDARSWFASLPSPPSADEMDVLVPLVLEAIQSGIDWDRVSESCNDVWDERFRARRKMPVFFSGGGTSRGTVSATWYVWTASGISFLAWAAIAYFIVRPRSRANHGAV